MENPVRTIMDRFQSVFSTPPTAVIMSHWGAVGRWMSCRKIVVVVCVSLIGIFIALFKNRVRSSSELVFKASTRASRVGFDSTEWLQSHQPKDSSYLQHCGIRHEDVALWVHNYSLKFPGLNVHQNRAIQLPTNVTFEDIVEGLSFYVEIYGREEMNRALANQEDLFNRSVIEFGPEVVTVLGAKMTSLLKHAMLKNRAKTVEVFCRLGVHRVVHQDALDLAKANKNDEMIELLTKTTPNQSNNCIY